MINLKKNKSTISFIAVLFLSGVVLMFSDKLFSVKDNSRESEKSQETIYDNTEIRLAELLSNVQGVGAVKVMIEYSEGKETVIAQNHTTENSSQSGNAQSKTQDEVALSNDNPIILKEIKPKVKGVIIVAQGGNNVEIKKQLISAVMSLLDIEANKIEVLTMK